MKLYICPKCKKLLFNDSNYYARVKLDSWGMEVAECPDCHSVLKRNDWMELDSDTGNLIIRKKNIYRKVQNDRAYEHNDKYAKNDIRLLTLDFLTYSYRSEPHPKIKSLDQLLKTAGLDEKFLSWKWIDKSEKHGILRYIANPLVFFAPFAVIAFFIIFMTVGLFRDAGSAVVLTVILGGGFLLSLLLMYYVIRCYKNQFWIYITPKSIGFETGWKRKNKPVTFELDARKICVGFQTYLSRKVRCTIASEDNRYHRIELDCTFADDDLIKLLRVLISADL